jgi:Domain of unknown function (DUF4383)
MSAPNFALVVGTIYLLLGLAGSFGNLAAGMVLNGLHLVIGVWGFLAWTGYLSALAFARAGALLLGVLALLGFLPATSTLFGYAALYGPEAWLHAATAVAAAYIGLRSKLRHETRTERRGDASGERRRTARLVAYERRRGRADRRFGGGTLAAG